MSSDRDPLLVLRQGPMSATQIAGICLCILINIIDGYDILASSFTAAAIARDLALTTPQLGVFFSAGPLGMMVGALFLSPLADAIGRRPLVLLCLALTAAGTLATAASPTLPLLATSRALTGLGVGAMMAAINTVVAELANDRRRDLAVCLQAAGFPLGGVLGGACVYALGDLPWGWVYVIGGAFSAILIPMVLVWMPESLAFLIGRRPLNALEKANHLLGRLKLPPMTELPAAERRAAGGPPVALVLTPSGLAMCASFFLLMFTFYFLSSWIPKILTDAGASAQIGISSAVMLSLGGVAGDLIFAGLTTRWSAARLSPIFAAACFATAVVFVNVATTPGAVLPVALLLGVFLYATMASHYAIVPTVFPAAVRSSGTGLALGVGRMGATVGPLAGGLLLGADLGRGLAIVAMAAPLLACGLIAHWISRRPTAL